MSDLRKNRTNTFIFMVFDSLLKQHEFSDINVIQIAKASMIHRNTFYRHFEDKYDLLHQFIELTLNQEITLQNISNFKEHPFSIINELCYEKFNSILDKQKYDESFTRVFAETFLNMILKNSNDQNNIWVFGDISSILRWNQMNGNTLNIFDDYQLLDSIYRERRFPD